MKKSLRLEDFSRDGESQLTQVNIDELIPLPPPYDKTEEQPEWRGISKEQKDRVVCNLDGVVALSLPKPQNQEEEERAVQQFAAGLRKLLTRENNWTFLQPLLLSIDYCAQCQTCNDACPIYLASGKNDLYRPTYRSEILRRLVDKYVKRGGRIRAKLRRGDVELNWTTITRLYELSYRCTLCRRCAQSCPMGLDNALITRELRKLFSQELGWAPIELHEKGTVLQLMPAALHRMAKAAMFSGQDSISPALCIRRTSEPSASHGVVTCTPMTSVKSSSMNSTLSLATLGLIPVGEPTSSWSTVPFS